MLSSLHMNISTDRFQKVKEMLTKELRMRSKPDAAPIRIEPTNPPAPTTHVDNENSLLYKSHGGLFAGILVLCGLILVLALFFTTHTKDAYKGSLIYHTSNMVLTLILLFGIVLGFISLRHLGRTLERINAIDDFLILFSMIGYLLLQFFIIISCMYFLLDKYDFEDDDLNEENIETVVRLEISVACLESVHCIIQAIFVMDCLQRFANDSDQAHTKKGRGILGFLVIVNVCMWVFKSFLIKEVVLSRHSGFYGDMAWPVIMSVCLPLQLFFFFHSSVCLAEAWSEAYTVKQDSAYATKPFIGIRESGYI